MILQSQIITKTNSLKAYSISQNATTEALFVPLENAVNIYFDGDFDIKKELSDVIKYMYNDIWRRNTVYSNVFPLSLPIINYPLGYNDVRDCFYQFEELLAIDNETFYAGFVFETGGTPEEPTQIPTLNVYIDAWIVEINQAQATNKSNLIALSEWCKNSEGDSDLISLFENRGTIVATLTMQEIANILYNGRGILDIINTLNAGVYIPSYI